MPNFYRMPQRYTHPSVQQVHIVAASPSQVESQFDVQQNGSAAQTTASHGGQLQPTPLPLAQQLQGGGTPPSPPPGPPRRGHTKASAVLSFPPTLGPGVLSRVMVHARIGLLVRLDADQ